MVSEQFNSLDSLNINIYNNANFSPINQNFDNFSKFKTIGPSLNSRKNT